MAGFEGHALRLKGNRWYQNQGALPSWDIPAKEDSQLPELVQVKEHLIFENRQSGIPDLNQYAYR